MAHADPPSTATPAQPDWRSIHALGLPAGSVRALLALLVFATIWGLLVLRPDQELPEYLKDLMFIIMGHYFAVRHRMESGEEPGPPPLYLPRGSVRLILILGFVVSAALLLWRERLLKVDQNPGVVTLLLAFGFLLGVVLRTVSGWWSERVRRMPRIIEDARAIVSLLAAVSLAVLAWNQFFDFLPKTPAGALHEIRLGLGRLGPPHVLAAVVGFYFGSRS